jgi:cbb3-type cytochrome oxidase subunit 1
MSISVPYRFMLSAILFVVIGMVLGLYMGPSQDFTLVPVHVHLNLLGWATMMLFGLYYRTDPASAGKAIAGWHFWIAFIGMVLFAVGLTGLQLGNPSLELVLIVGSVMSLVAMLIFGWVVWQAAMRKG